MFRKGYKNILIILKRLANDISLLNVILSDEVKIVILYNLENNKINN